MIQFLLLIKLTNDILIKPRNKFAFCFVACAPIRSDAKDESEIESQLVFGEPVKIVSLNKNWCFIKSCVDGYQGFVDPKQLQPLSQRECENWQEEYCFLKALEGVVINESEAYRIPRGSFVGKEDFFSIGTRRYQNISVQKSSSLWETSKEYINTPYLWGGKTPWGIDCSGLTQVIYRIYGYNLPRDAYMQANEGLLVQYVDKKPGDLAFFENSSGKLTHVGIVGPKHQIIHAAGFVKIDLLTVEGIWNEKYNRQTHKLAQIRRVL